MPIKTFAFKMKLLPGMEEEYQRRHDAIWPELKQLLLDSGIIEYHIFLDRETYTLFAFQKLDGEQNSQELGKNPLVQKWWAYMADIMETHPDNAPISQELKEVFKL
ncbi:L-rhamnose mutarotase [Cecembia calidifontis]|uniref:L-rhamnose mutarotase n=2 Tax=Cecembia calidifontis TaxID=1187080 RepID=A0A4Q7PA40_9BACT|nr:L-rhamnose mutarotase [Cecembia calidifontis]